MKERFLDNYPDVLMPEEAQKVLNISRSTIYKLLKSGELASVRVGKLYRIPKIYLQKYLESCYCQTHTDDLSTLATI